MIYIIDASSLITPMNLRYPPAVFKTLWDKMSDSLADGTIISSEVVLVELEKGSDDLVKWAKKYKNAFQPVTSEEAEEMAKILTKYPKLVDATLGAESADPYLIAKAKMGGDFFTLVSEESKTKPNKIPYVCKLEGVKCIDFITMLKELTWEF